MAEKKANPEQFARVVLWHLASLRADCLILQNQFDFLHEYLEGKTNPKSRKELEKRAKDLRLHLYGEAFAEAGLKPDFDGPSEN